mgnify:CR=1 FL=1
MAKDLRIILLLDCYGAFLTPRQQEMMTHYYSEDLSLGEIAALTGTTRQAVRDSVKRSEQVLNDMEEKELIVMEATAQGLKKARETAE